MRNNTDSSHHVGSVIKREPQTILRNRDCMVLLALCFALVAGLVSLTIYNDTSLSRRQIAAILLSEPLEIRKRALANLRADYGIQALGDPITRGRLRSAIYDAESEVEYNRLRADTEQASASSRSTLDAVSRSVERTQ